MNKEKENSVLKRGSATVAEFKEFISKGNIVDMAVGVIIGSAFGKIVSSLVDNIFMPIIGILVGGLDFSGLCFRVKDVEITYGIFIQNVVDFLIVALCMFLMIKFLAKFKKREVKEREVVVDEKVELLKEIRDLLKDSK